MTVSGKLNLPSADLGGESSRTDQSEKGNKPKELTVSSSIRFNDVSDLNLLIKLAEALDDNGERIIYNITNKTAEGMGIRQVVFSDNVMVNENESLRQWRCRFSLIEYRSTSEKAEERIAKKENSVTEPEGEVIASAASENEALKPEGMVENAIASIEDLLS